VIEPVGEESVGRLSPSHRALRNTRPDPIRQRQATLLVPILDVFERPLRQGDPQPHQMGPVWGKATP
jgi:hypothetical protein